MPFGAIASDSVGGAGGTCVLRGCVPKKLFVYAASFREEFKESRGFGCALNTLCPKFRRFKSPRPKALLRARQQRVARLPSHRSWGSCS